jgi:hypothetical protein
MKQRYDICRLVKCSNLNTKESKCSFDNCLFTTEELKIKAESAENAEFSIMLMKCAGAVAMLILFMLWAYSKLGWI